MIRQMHWQIQMSSGQANGRDTTISQIFRLEAVTIIILPVSVFWSHTNIQTKIDVSFKIVKPYHFQYLSFAIISLGLSEMDC